MEDTEVPELARDKRREARAGSFGCALFTLSRRETTFEATVLREQKPVDMTRCFA